MLKAQKSAFLLAKIRKKFYIGVNKIIWRNQKWDYLARKT